MKFSRGAIALYVGLVFASGVVLGAFGHRLYTVSTTVSAKAVRNPEEFRKKIIAEYRSRLHLTDDQVTKLNMLMDETRARVESTRQKLHPAYQKIRAEQNEKIRQLLSPEQQAEFDKMHKEREERQQRQKQQQPARDPGTGPGF
jgi:Spy/CpxP family protein refolding chaperone